MTLYAKSRPSAQVRWIFALSIAAFFGVVGPLIWVGSDDDLFAYAPLAILGLGALSWVVVSACRGRAWAMGTYLGILVFMANASFRSRNVGDFEVDWQSGLKFFIWSFALLIGLCCLANVRLLFRAAHNRLYLIYVLYALASTIYSVSPLYTLASAIGMLGVFLFSVVAAHALGMKQIALITVGALAAFILASWVVDLTLPEYSRTTSWSVYGTVERMGGIAVHPNFLGKSTAVFAVFAIILYRNRQLHWASCMAALLLTAATMWATDSRTSAVGTVAAICFVAVRRSPWLLAIGVLLLIAGAGVLLVLPSHDLVELLTHLSRSGDVGEILTLTGRVELWKFVWEQSMESPLIGYGFSVSEHFLTPTYPYFELGWDAHGAHNMILQTLLTLGLLGVVLVGLVIWRLAALYMSAPAPYRDAMLGLVLISGVMGSGPFSTSPNLLTLMVLVTMAASEAKTEAPFERSRT